MDINTLNTKRKITLIISVSLMVIIIAISSVFLILGMYNTYFFIGAPLFLVTFLFLLSKFIVIPRYENIKKEIFTFNLCERYKDVKVNYHKDKFEILDNFYDNKMTKKEQNYHIIIRNNEYKTLLFSKKYTRNSALTFDYSGFIISTNNYISDDEFIIIKQNAVNSSQVINFYKDNYKIINNEITSNHKYYRYTLLTNNDNVNYDIINYLEDFEKFNIIIVNKDNITIIVDTKIKPINFKLQYPLNKNDLVDFKNDMSPLFKMIDIFENRRRS